MKKKQISLEEFEKESKAETAEREKRETRDRERGRSIVKLRVQDLEGPISYVWHDDWWWAMVGDTQIGCFTSERSARNWCKMMLGREI